MPKKKKLDNSKEPPKKILWYEDYDIMLPWCPSCNEPAYEHDKCVFCGQPFIWVDKPKGYEDIVVSYKDYTATQVYGSWGVYIEKKNGTLCTHMSCARKMSKRELLNILKGMTSNAKDKVLPKIGKTNR